MASENFKRFTYTSEAVGDLDITGTSVEKLEIEGVCFFSSSGSAKSSIAKVTIPDGAPDVCFFSIIEVLTFIEKSTKNIKLESFEISEAGRKITGIINLDKYVY